MTWQGCKAGPVLSTGLELVRGDSWRPEAGETAQTGSRDDSRWPYPVTLQKVSRRSQSGQTGHELVGKQPVERGQGASDFVFAFVG